MIGIDWAKRDGDSGGKNAGEGLKLVGNRAWESLPTPYQSITSYFSEGTAKVDFDSIR